eukprot:m.151785 g.151785  ORF g.151785 m.151785 type:complete len:55 (+) comp13295_c0_seq12:694-858(+)
MQRCIVLYKIDFTVYKCCSILITMLWQDRMDTSMHIQKHKYSSITNTSVLYTLV